MPKVVRRGGRDIILNVKRACELERDEQGPVVQFSKVRARVAFLTGVSERTVTQITKEGKQAEASSTQIVTPGKKRNRARMISSITGFEKCTIRHKIHSFYIVKKELPSIYKLWLELKSDIDFRYSCTSLRRILKSMGFHYRLCESKRKVLLERDNIAAWRARYILRLRKNRCEEQRPVIYINQTYIHAYHAQKDCTDDDEPGGVGARWIIAHAGGRCGFIENGLLMFKSKSKALDFRDDIDAETYWQWIVAKVLPNLPPECLVVMDYAPYNCTQINTAPTMGNTKAEMQDWLRENKIMFEECWTKPQLFEIINKNKGPPEYSIEKMMSDYGHEVVRIPPYHCDLNPLEKLWGDVKRQISEKNDGEAGNDIETITTSAFSKVTSREWRNICAHVEKIEDQYYEYDRLLDIELDKFIINSADACSGSESSESHSDISDSDDDFYLLQVL